MISRTKFKIDNAAVGKLVSSAGLGEAEEISPLGAGEYNAVFSAVAEGREYAVKIAPEASVSILTYEKDMMASEVFWYGQIKEHTRIIVPKILYTDFSKKRIPADYFIMEKLKGEQLDKIDFSGAENNSVAELAKMAARIHKIKNDRFGYIQNGLHDNWYKAIRAMTVSLFSDCARKGKRSNRGKKLIAFIDRYKDVLEKAECCMVNFDLWPSNIICSREGGEITYAWIDPERSFWGDSIADFVCLEVMKSLEEKKDSLMAYNSVAERPVNATPEEKIRYAVAQGYLGLILETEKYYRYTPLHYGWWRNVTAAKMFFGKAFEVLETALI